MREANFMIWNFTVAPIGGIYFTYKNIEDYLDEIRDINDKKLYEVCFIPVFNYISDYWQDIYDFITTNESFISKLHDYNSMYKLIIKITNNYSRDRAVTQEEFLADQEAWEELITNPDACLEIFGAVNGISFIDSRGIESKLGQLKQLTCESIDMLEYRKKYYIQ